MLFSAFRRPISAWKRTDRHLTRLSVCSACVYRCGLRFPLWCTQSNQLSASARQLLLPAHLFRNRSSASTAHKVQQVPCSLSFELLYIFFRLLSPKMWLFALVSVLFLSMCYRSLTCLCSGSFLDPLSLAFPPRISDAIHSLLCSAHWPGTADPFLSSRNSVTMIAG